MDKRTLKQRLIKEKFDSSWYCLEGDKLDEGFCLDYIQDVWVTYYLERGHKFEYLEHASEYEACQNIYKNLYEEPKSRKRKFKY